MPITNRGLWVRDARRHRVLSRWKTCLERARFNWLATASTLRPCARRHAEGALLFLYGEVLGQEVPWIDGIVHAKRPWRLPVVLTRDEIRAILAQLSGVPRLMALLLYGAGLRVLECARLRVKDIDVESNQIVMRAGKGDRDRMTVLPAAGKADLARHLETVRRQHERDLKSAPGGSNCRAR